MKYYVENETTWKEKKTWADKLIDEEKKETDGEVVEWNFASGQSFWS